MNMNHLVKEIAEACETKPKTVAAVQKETFRRIRAALGKGERVSVAEFGIFATKEVPGEEGQPAKKIIRFRERTAKDADAKEERTEEAETAEA
jgi:nucleoid DNA-binding protein